MNDTDFRMPTTHQVKWIDHRYFHTQAEANQRLICIAIRMGFDAERAVVGCEFPAESERLNHLAVKAQTHINDNLSRGYKVEWEQGDLVCRRRLSGREAAHADYQRAERRYAAKVQFGATDAELRAAQREVAKMHGVWRNFVNAQRTTELAQPELKGASR